MTLGVVGDGPAADAVAAAVADVECEPASIRPGDVGAVELAVVVGSVGTDAFGETTAAARESGTPWLAVELGGVGGYAVPDVEASVAGFGPETGCYDCLRARVEANLDEPAGDATEPDAPVVRFAGAIAGREAAAVLGRDDASALGRVVEIPHAERRFLPVPSCACVSDREWSLDRAYASRELDVVLAHAERALDGRVGLVGEVGEAESFPAPYYLATTCDTSVFSDASALRQAAGVAVDWNAAFVKALGEALERYSASVYRTAELDRATVDSVDDGVDPRRFVTSPSFDAPSPGDELRWIPGVDLHDGADVRLPATFALFPPPETRYRPALTTGLALGSSTVEALCGGLYEVVERDAAMLAWYSTYEPIELAVEDAAYRTLARRARSEGLEATALLLTADVDVPVVAAAVHRDGDWPRFATGMGASLDPAAAARAALEEALQNWMELRGMGPDDAAAESGAIGHYAQFPAAARAFVDADATAPTDGIGLPDVPEGEAELDALLDRLAAAGLDAYGVRLTPPDVERVGFEAVRALVPAAQPLFSDDPYFGARAETVPREMGFEPRPGRDHHPFP